MIIEVRHCNNIDFANISLLEGKLNIKYAPNGSGKSSIAKALLFGAEDGQARLSELLPFKLRKDNPDNKRPEVLGAESIKTIMCFNDDYVSRFVFKPDELLSNSFEILIKTDAYKKLEQEIEELISGIKKLFLDNQELEAVIATLKEMGDAFKLTKTGLSKSTTGMKALTAGNKIQHIPKGLESYQPFIQSDSNISWIEWQTKGCVFSEISDNCPFCTSFAGDKKEQIQKVGKEYDKNIIRNLVAIINVIEKLGDYFSPDAKQKLETISTLKDGLDDEHEAFLTTVKSQIDNFTGKLERLRTISGLQFNDGEKVVEKLPAYKLDFHFFSELKSVRMQEAIDPINCSIDTVIEKAGQLQGKINQLRKKIRDTVSQHQTDINNFLAYAGYRYEVEIVGEESKSQLKLRHVDHDEHLTGGDQHLSFGEKNAFAIVLFMYECLSKRPDLIILDDPISSFDKNKKYAILEMLFRGDSSSCLKNKTVLMLTHDIEPVIDTIKSLGKTFYNLTTASFLRLEKCQINERVITRADIQPFSQICKSVISSSKDDIVKLIYLRRYLEISDDKGDAYQVLSNILHKRKDLIDTRIQGTDGEYPKMDSAKVSNGCLEIVREVTNFSYSDFLRRLQDKSVLRMLYDTSTNGYEKLQVFRLFDFELKDRVIQKFINETFHIENEFICQLDPTKFDTIPEYVVTECDRILKEME